MVRRFKLSVEKATELGRKALHLDTLHTTTVLDWLREGVESSEDVASVVESARRS